ncbi:MAG TPA: anthrax toxin-like adenylyl cyclase domain-containing protein, partial [Gemmatimonadaceae bacterium]
MKVNSQDFLINTIGMPVPHKAAFLNVAALQRCVILVRATGPTCHGPLSEGYDTKGYRVHGKSCDWGPMAGFVVRDPRLNKYGLGKAKFNRAKHKEALYDDHEGQGWRASTTPLRISLARIEWLASKG